MSHEANYSKDYKAGEEAGAAIANSDHDSIPDNDEIIIQELIQLCLSSKNYQLKRNLPEYIVSEFVIACQRYHPTPCNSQRKENLNTSIGPDLKLRNKTIINIEWVFAQDLSNWQS